MEGANYTLVSISAEVALRAGRFTSDHRDPFDRVIAAQALHDDIPVLSSDEKLDTFLVQRIW
jgi:PIN domain nuclease of toxin-antitoxin system